MKKIILTTLLPIVAILLSGCGNTSYVHGVNASRISNTEFSNVLQEQLTTVQLCYMFSKDTKECSITLAGIAATQTLGGRPTPIRIAQSPEEIVGVIADKGFDAAVKIFGLKQIGNVLSKGISESGKI